MTEVLSFPGPEKLTEARQTAWLERLRPLASGLEGLTAAACTFVNLDAPLDAAQRSRLEAVLEGPPWVPGAGWAPLVLVVPRPGTQSPWSTKATDILKGCGLAEVARVEQGLRWYYRGTLSEAERTALAAALVDRMTEAALAPGSDGSVLFSAEAPRPLQTVPLWRRGAPPSRQPMALWALRCPKMKLLILSRRS